MKKILTFTVILSWINLLVGALLVLVGLIGLFTSPAILMAIYMIVLCGAVVLHSYASLQLRRSIIYPSIPLSRQTPSGIRIMSFMALFFAIMSFPSAIVLIQQAPALAKLIQVTPQTKNFNYVPILRVLGIIGIIISLSIFTNVILNFRLLKWYIISTAAENKKEND